MGTARKVLLVVTGGVAAYKAAYLARRLVERGHDVTAVMSEAATRFLGPQTLAAVTTKAVHTRLFGGETPSPHTELARWAEVIVVAPATASFLGRIGAGISDDLVTATILAAQAPVVVAPAMHTEMWEHPATVRNVARLEGDGYRLVGPATGPLAGGDEGLGRMVDPDVLVFEVEAADRRWDWAGRRVVVTSGGTREPLDPVRYIGNYSSGKMGNAVAAAAAARGAAVDLITAAPAVDHPGVRAWEVSSADEMAAATWERAPGADVAVLAAAVADFQPVAAAATKLRRHDGPPDVALTATPDVLAGVVAAAERPFVVGFAAETQAAEAAKEKAAAKGVDLLVANDVTDPDSGFGADTNRVSLIEPDGTIEHWPVLSKWEVAMRLLDVVVTRLGEAQTH